MLLNKLQSEGLEMFSTNPQLAYLSQVLTPLLTDLRAINTTATGWTFSPVAPTDNTIPDGSFWLVANGDLYYKAAGTWTLLFNISGGGGGGAVTSVFGRVGVVTADPGDYAGSDITNDSGVTGATVSDALNTLSAAIPVGTFLLNTGATTGATASAQTFTLGTITNLVKAIAAGNLVLQNNGGTNNITLLNTGGITATGATFSFTAIAGDITFPVQGLLTDIIRDAVNGLSLTSANVTPQGNRIQLDSSGGVLALGDIMTSSGGLTMKIDDSANIIFIDNAAHTADISMNGHSTANDTLAAVIGSGTAVVRGGLICVD